MAKKATQKENAAPKKQSVRAKVAAPKEVVVTAKVGQEFEYLGSKYKVVEVPTADSRIFKAENLTTKSIRRIPVSVLK